MTRALRADSVAIRWLEGSAMAHWWLARPTSTQRLDGSMAWQALGSRWAVLLLTAVILMMVGLGGLSGLVLAAVAGLAWKFPVGATALLPLALISSWRVSLGGTADEALFLRPSDALLLGALVRAAHEPATARLRGASVLHASVIIAIVLLWSAVAGWLRETNAAPQAAVLLLVQWGALVGTFLLAHHYARRLGRWGMLAWSGAVCAAAGFGIAEALSPLSHAPGEYRSFERLWFDGQANHYGGLFAFAVCVGTGLFLHPRYRFAGLILASIAAMGLGATKSDSSLVAMISGLGVFAVLRYPVLLGLLVFAPLAALVMPWAKIESAMLPGTSMHDRLVAWKSALSTFPEYSLLGLGAAARHRSFYDNHYVMALAETGIAGLMAWLYWLAVTARALSQSMRGAELRAWCLAAGAMAGWAALSVHALANISFVITVVAGPALWWTGYVLATEKDA